MQYIRIKNFEQYQHYKKRKPPWFKVYRQLWRNERFYSLSEAERYQLISLYMLASQHDNMIPVRESWLQHEIVCEKPLNVMKFVETEWCELVGEMSSDASISVTSVASIKTETETEAQRQNKKENPSLRSGQKKRAPDEFLISASMKAWAVKNGITCSLEVETEAMLDHHRGKGNLHSDWVATWRTWMRNWKRFRGNSDGKRESESERRIRVTKEAGDELRARFDIQNRGSLPGGSHEGDAGDLSGTIIDISADSD